MIVDLILAKKLWDDRIILTVARRAPTIEKYGSIRMGAEITPKSEVQIEERSALYRLPYTPSTGGERYCGLASIGMLSYSYSAIPEPVSIGRYCSISDGLVFLDSHHPLESVTSSIIGFRPRNRICSDITSRKTIRETDWHVRGNKPWPTIEHDVWIGRNVTMALGVKIGTGAVVASQAVVTKNVEPYSIVAGNPARHRKYRIEDDALRNDLLSSEWWNYHPADVERLGLGEPKEFLSKLALAVSSGSIKKYKPTTYSIRESVKRVEGGYVLAP